MMDEMLLKKEMMNVIHFSGLLSLNSSHLLHIFFSANDIDDVLQLMLLEHCGVLVTYPAMDSRVDTVILIVEIDLQLLLFFKSMGSHLYFM